MGFGHSECWVPGVELRRCRVNPGRWYSRTLASRLRLGRLTLADDASSGLAHADAFCVGDLDKEIRCLADADAWRAARMPLACCGHPRTLLWVAADARGDAAGETEGMTARPRTFKMAISWPPRGLTTDSLFASWSPASAPADRRSPTVGALVQPPDSVLVRHAAVTL